MKRATLILASLAAWLVIVALVMTSPAQAQDPGPVQNALATLAAATARADAIRSAQRATAAALSAQATSQAMVAQATAAALSAQATRQAQSVMATAQAQSAQATQSAIDELNRQRAATATAQAQNAQATRTAQEATATAQVQNAQATATSQAVMIAAQATDTARLSATYAQRQERFSLGLLVVELAAIVGALWVLWRLARTLAAWADKMRPTDAPTLAGLIAATATAQPSAGAVVIDQAQAPEPRMPSFVQVVDNPAMEAAISRWAERFDAEHGGDYDDE